MRIILGDLYRTYSWFSTPFQPAKGKLVTVFSHVPYLWSLYFEIISLGNPPNDFTNILSITEEGDEVPCCTHGGRRAPTVFTDSGTERLMIDSYLNGKGNYRVGLYI